MASLDFEEHSEMAAATTSPERVRRYFRDYRLMYKAITEDDWGTIRRFLNDNPDALVAPINQSGETILAIATNFGQTRIVENLVGMMPPETLQLKDMEGFTVLHITSNSGNTKLAEIFVSKNPNLLQMRDNSGVTPLLQAALYGRRELLLYLLCLTRAVDPSPFMGTDGATLLSATVGANFYDIALDIVQMFPTITFVRDHFGNHALQILAERSWPSMNRAEGRLAGFVNAWKRLDVDNVDYVIIMYKQYLNLVDCICNQVLLLDDETTMVELLKGSTLKAARHGNVDFIKSIVKIDPNQIRVTDHNVGSMLHIAVVFRQESVFNYIKDLDHFKKIWADRIDHYGECILHTVARLSHHSSKEKAYRAGLQMQKDLQWYKAVENIVRPFFKDMRNINGKSPKDVFVEEHIALRANGEKWMKELAVSTMVVPILIATVAFSAAFTVPGGNNNDTGTPIFLYAPSYVVFAVSDALALFSSLNATLILLSIYTARYADKDFLKSVPQNLMIALFMIFFSIASMTIAFSATYFIILTHRYLWLSIIIALLTCSPVTLFALSQLPLFLEIMSSTYWPAI